MTVNGAYFARNDNKWDMLAQNDSGRNTFAQDDNERDVLGRDDSERGMASLEMTKNVNEGAPLGGIGVTDYAGEMTGCEDRLVADVRIGYVESNGIRACLLMRPPHSLKRCG